MAVCILLQSFYVSALFLHYFDTISWLAGKS